MLGGLVNQVRDQAAQKVRAAMVKIALAVGALFLILISAGFFIAAASRALADRYGDLIADLILGGAFLAVALLLIVIASRPSKQAGASAAATGAASENPASTPLTATIAAFAYGFARGLGNKQRRKAGSTTE